MITLTLFDFYFRTTEKNAKQFARDIAVLLDGGIDCACMPSVMAIEQCEDGWEVRVNNIRGDLKIPGADQFRKWITLRPRSIGEVATEALKLTKTSLDPQAKVIAALTRHLPREDALF